MDLRAFVEERLGYMTKTPGAFALTKEGFAMQVLVLLEILEVEEPISLFSPLDPSRVFREPLDNPFADKVIAIAREAIAKLPAVP